MWIDFDKLYWSPVCIFQDFPGGSVVKNPPANAGDAGVADLVPGWGRSPGTGNRNSLLYSCLKNPMHQRAWQATVHGVTKSHTHTCCVFHESVVLWSCFYLFSPMTWQGEISTSIRMICFFPVQWAIFSAPSNKQSILFPLLNWYHM